MAIPSSPDEPTVRGPSSASVPPPSSSTPPQGTPFGRYVLLEQLGRGGMGVVWKAWDPELKRVVALKQVLSEKDPDLVERFAREAQAAARLRHPAIVSVYDVGVIEGWHFFTSEYVEGKSLEAVPCPLPPRQAAEVVRGVAEALAYAHAQGILHRDVKPANILLDAEGRPHVMDFGLAKDLRKELGESLTLSGQILGTPTYMSPEQARGEMRAVGAASDQFSLGSVLFQLLTGRRPFEGVGLMEILEAVIEREPMRPSRIQAKVQRDLETVCLKAMEKDPARRYASMGAFAADLGRWLAGEPIEARPTGAIERWWRKAARRPLLAATGAAVVVLAIAFVTYGVVAHARQIDLQRKAQETETAKQLQDVAVRAMTSAGRALDLARHYLYEKDVKCEELAQQAERARVSIEDALAKAPDLPVGPYLLGQSWDLLGWDDKAEACFRRSIAIDPNFAPAQYELGLLLVRNALVEAMGTPESPGTFRWDVVKTVVCEAGQHLEAASSGEMGSDLQRAVAKAASAYVFGNEDARRDICTEALRRYGERNGAEMLHFFLAMCAPDKDARGRQIDLAIQVCPKDWLALYHRAVWRHDEGDTAGAIEDYNAVLAVKPRFAQAYNSRGNARDDGHDPGGAIEDYGQAIALNPRYVKPYVARSDLRRRRKDLRGAIADCDAALAIDPRHAGAYVNRGNARADQGDLDGAIADYDRALDLNPKMKEAFQSRGKARRRKGNLDGAIADYDQALALDDRYVSALVGRGNARAIKGELSGAIADYDRAIEIDASDTRAYADRGDTHLALGEVERAREDYERAVAAATRDAPCPPNARASLDRIREAMKSGATEWLVEATRAGSAVLRGDFAAAEGEYERALRAAPAEMGSATRAGVSNIHYNLACICSVYSTGRKDPRASATPIADAEAGRLRDRAFEHLRKAIELGFGPKEDVLQDQDLLPLHDDPRWKELTDQIPK